MKMLPMSNDQWSFDRYAEGHDGEIDFFLDQIYINPSLVLTKPRSRSKKPA